MYKRLGNEKELRIIEMWECGMNCPYIGQASNVPCSTISIVLMFQKVHGSIEEIKNNDRPWKLNACGVRELSYIICAYWQQLFLEIAS
jgi:hypothetical protein